MPLVNNSFHENIVYGLYGDGNNSDYYVIGNNAATICDKNGYVYMTSEYSQWFKFPFTENCNVTTGKNAVTAVKCDEPDTAYFVFVKENSEGLIVDWTRPYPACTHVLKITVTEKLKAVDEFLVTFIGTWTFAHGVWTNRYAGSTAHKRTPCYFKLCINSDNEALPEYIINELVCYQDYNGKTVIGIYSFPYFGMVKS